MDNKLSINNSQEEIDIESLIRLISKKRKFILATAIGGFALACFISLIPKRTWKGEFQIVIDNPSQDNKISNVLNNSSLAIL